MSGAITEGYAGVARILTNAAPTVKGRDMDDADKTAREMTEEWVEDHKNKARTLAEPEAPEAQDEKDPRDAVMASTRELVVARIRGAMRIYMDVASEVCPVDTSAMADRLLDVASEAIHCAYTLRALEPMMMSGTKRAEGVPAAESR